MGNRVIEKTRVPIGWVFTLLSCSGGAMVIAVGVGIYAGKAESKSGAALEKAEEAKAAVVRTNEIMGSIDSRLSRIEGALDIPPLRRKK